MNQTEPIVYPLCPETAVSNSVIRGLKMVGEQSFLTAGLQQDESQPRPIKSESQRTGSRHQYSSKALKSPPMIPACSQDESHCQRGCFWSLQTYLLPCYPSCSVCEFLKDFL